MVIQGFSNFLGLFQGIMANPEDGQGSQNQFYLIFLMVLFQAPAVHLQETRDLQKKWIER